jgi:hypothetical protein
MSGINHCAYVYVQLWDSVVYPNDCKFEFCHRSGHRITLLELINSFKFTEWEDKFQ